MSSPTVLRRLAVALLTLAVALALAACGGDGDDDSDASLPADATTEQADGADSTEGSDAEPTVVTFDRETVFRPTSLTPEQRRQFEERQATAVAGVSGTIAGTPGNAGIGPDDVRIDPAVEVSDGGEVVHVTMRVSGVRIVSPVGRIVPDEEERVDGYFPLLGADGELSSVDDPTAVVEHAIVFGPNFVPDRSDPFDSAVDFNDAIGGGDSRTERPDGDPVAFFQVDGGPAFIVPGA